MITAISGATGRIGGAVTQRLLDADQTARALVRNPDKASRLFGNPRNLKVLSVQLDDPVTVAKALSGADTAFVAMGSIGIEANLQWTAHHHHGARPARPRAAHHRGIPARKPRLIPLSVTGAYNSIPVRKAWATA